MDEKLRSMPGPPPPAKVPAGALGRREWLAGLALGAAHLALGSPQLGCRSRKTPPPVFLDLALEAPGPQPGLLREGLVVLLSDYLEAFGGCTVVSARGTSSLPLSPAGSVGVRGRGRWAAGALGFDLEVTAPDGRVSRRAGGPFPPLAALDWFMSTLPLPVPRGEARRLAPARSDLFERLLACLGAQDDPAWSGAAFALAREVEREAAPCATPPFLEGYQLYNLLLLHPQTHDNQWKAFAAHRRGLDLVPHHPRASGSLGRFLADAGLHREALELLGGSLQAHPHVASLYAALSYVSRTCGLLDLAGRSLGKVERLTLQASGLITETAYLYLGQWEAFRRTCRLEGTGRDARVHFYLGYLALAEGDPDLARGSFEACLRVPGGWYGFELLSRLYLLSMAGRKEEGLGLLKDFLQKRAGLQAPDGELSFKFAEAAAHLGDAEQAIRLGELAFSQGFGCTRWYSGSPLFAPARDTSRWWLLKQHLEERQALLAGRYPPQRFGL